MSNRSILHAIASLEGGGAERQLAMLASEQIRRGWDVHLALRRGGNFQALLDDAVHLHWLGDHDGPSATVLWRLVQTLRTVRPAIVQSWLPQMDVLAGLASHVTRSTWVMTERGAAPISQSGLATHVRSRLGRTADAIVANSEAGARDWSSHPHVSVIPNAVGIDVQRAPSATPLVVFAGRLVESKGAATLIAALRMLATPPRTIIFGDGPERDRLLAASAGLPITFAGFRDDWWTTLATASVFVSPSRAEGEPNVILEGLAAGCPIVASDIPAHRALLDPACLFSDVTTLAEKLVAPPPAMQAPPRPIVHTAERYEAVYSAARAQSRPCE